MQSIGLRSVAVRWVSIAVRTCVVVFAVAALVGSVQAREDRKPARPDVHAAAAMVIDDSSGQVLYEKNADEIHPIASITKLMTAMVVVDAKLDPQERIEILEADKPTIKWSRSRLRVGNAFTRDDLLRIALMAWVDPASTTFQRSEMWRLATEQHRITWAQAWVDDDRVSAQLKRAVIASEDAGFASHAGADWDAMEKAWERNQRAQARTASRPQAAATGRLRGGSTITQQLAKNLLLSGERTVARKGQELLLAWMLELLLDKRRILEIYLNSVEWGEGVFGAEAAAQHYFRKGAARLSAWEAARR